MKMTRFCVGVANPDDYEYLNHTYTRDLAETYNVVYDWRDILDEYIEKQVHACFPCFKVYALRSDLLNIVELIGKTGFLCRVCTNEIY